MNKSSLFASLALCLLVSLFGCAKRGHDSKGARAIDPATPIRILPEDAKVPMGGRLELQAIRNGAPDPGVHWELLDSKAGLLLSKGVLLAGTQPGSYWVVAKDPRRSSTEARVKVEVLLQPGPVNSARHAELFDPATGAWSTVGALNEARFDHGAVLLTDGRVFLVGGGKAEDGFGFDDSSRGEIFDPRTRVFKPCLAGMGMRRAGLLSILLKDGSVLMLGGGTTWNAGTGDDEERLRTVAEVYDPAADAFRYAGECLGGQRALSLSNGKVVVVGDKISVFDPATKRSLVLEHEILHGLRGFTLHEINGGKVLILGGATNWDGSTMIPLVNAWVLDPDQLTLSKRGEAVIPRWGHAAILKGREAWLLGGMAKHTFNPPLTFRGTPLGYGPQEPTPTTEILDLDSWTFRSGPKLSQPLRAMPWVRLPSGKFFLAGSQYPDDPSASAFLLDPATGLVQQLLPMAQPRRGHTMTLLSDGRVLVAGGTSSRPKGLF